MQENFELESILSITTGINCCNDGEFTKVFELAWFVYDDPFISTMGLCSIVPELKEHLFCIHPELREVKFDKKVSFDKWITNQKEKFGEFLPVSQLGEKLVESKRR